MHDYTYKSNLNDFKSIDLSDISKLEMSNRSEIKYILPIANLRQLLYNVADEYDIVEVRGEKELSYHTIYFDTFDYNLYHNHHNGKANRYKVRMRSYAASGDSFLEVKKRTNKGRTQKIRRSIVNVHNFTDLHKSFIDSIIPSLDKDLIRSIETSYRRITLISFSLPERVTIDIDLRFSSIGSVYALPNVVIVEVKTDRRYGVSSPMTVALRGMKIYPRAFSKYCMGMAYLYPQLKQNLFKSNKLYLKKIEHDTTITN